MKCVAVVPQGLETQGVEELIALGVDSARPLRRCIAFEASKACFYRLHLQARLPFRLLREIARFKCKDQKSLYLGIQKAIDWELWLKPTMSFRVDVSGSSNIFNHSHFTALQVKNAIVDFQRRLWGCRSNVDLENPDFCLHLHLNQHEAILSLDGYKRSLHKRGYRSAVGIAPMKENLASGLIKLTGWNGSVPLVDPLCGSGTFLIEAASLALGLAVGKGRRFLFEQWADFELNMWENIVNDLNRKIPSRQSLPQILGSEKDSNIFKQAQHNVHLANLERSISLVNNDFQDLQLPSQKGLIVCNPPYGKRLGCIDSLPSLYERLGSFFKNNASGWELWLLSGDSELTRFLRMKSSRKFPISNGGIDCRWIKYLVH